jgi:hypothetical protein
VHGIAENNGDCTNYGGYFEAAGATVEVFMHMPLEMRAAAFLVLQATAAITPTTADILKRQD